MSETAQTHSLRDLPSIDLLMTDPLFCEIESRFGRRTSLRIARDAVELIRSNIAQGRPPSDDPLAGVVAAADEAYKRELLQGTRRVINATGVVVHTNLGRSPLSESAIERIRQSTWGYCALEFDLESGKRGKRGERAEAMISEITAAEGALIVNNCAAAAFLALRVLAADKGVIISRGELVEIGGDFRIPDVMAESGAVLREVGTTNRTKLNDYERAIDENTGMILRVHPSNFRVVGFTESPTTSALSELARKSQIPFVEDAGSGVLTDLSAYGLSDEPVIARSIADGADLVMFSGDKLMGGVQSGFIVGREDLISRIRRHPLYRALRVDKLAYAAIEATLGSYQRGSELNEIPTLRMIAASPDEIEKRGTKFVESIRSEGLRLEIVDGESVIGGGSAPNVHPPTWLISIVKDGLSPEDLAKRLRMGTVPVVARIDDDRLLLDLRTVFPDEEAELAEAIMSLED